MLHSVITQPKLVKAKEGWYVYIRHRITKEKKVFKLGLNCIKDEKIREREFNDLIRHLTYKIKNENWSPFEVDNQFSTNMYFIEALNFALNKKEDIVSPKTYSMYKSTVKFISEVSKKMKLEYFPITDIKRSHIRLILENCQKRYKWSNKNYNKNLNHLKAMLSVLIEWDVIEINMAHKIPSLKVSRTIANRTATPNEHKLIRDTLLSKHSNFYNFISLIFHTGIRPKEILLIQLYMIDFRNQTVTLPAEITKTDIDRIVPLNSEVISMLEDMEANVLPKNYYLFGSFRQKGKGNIGKHEDFICGPTPIKRDTATKRWKKIIKDGLGIDVNMYSYKHAGADAKIIAGISLDALRELYGHGSKLMTVKYARKVKEIYRKEILENSPSF